VLTIRMRISRTLLFKTLVRFLLLVVPAIFVVRILLSILGGIYDLDTFFSASRSFSNSSSDPGNNEAKTTGCDSA